MENNSSKKYRLLFADSNDSILTVFKMFENELNDLENGSFDCDFVATGPDAHEKLTTNKYDLAIIEYHLPGINGLEILEKLAFNDNPTPIIFQTGRGNEDIAIQAFRLGLKDYFKKQSLSFEELYSSIMNIIQGNSTSVLTPIPDVPSLNFLTHHLDSVMKGYMQEITEDDLITGHEYVFAFMSTKIFHDEKLEEELTFDEFKILYRNLHNYIKKISADYHGMKWIDKEEFMMHTFVGRNLVSNCFMCALNILNGIVMYNLIQKDIPKDFGIRIALNYGEAKYEPNKEVVISSSLNYNVHSIHFKDEPGLFASEFFYANMDEKMACFFEPSFELEGIQNFKFVL